MGKSASLEKEPSSGCWSPTALKEFPVTPSSLCSCILVTSGHHLADCELLYLDETIHRVVMDELSDTSSSGVEVSRRHRTPAQKRRHRESMSRQRQHLRESIASLQVQASQLEKTLRRTVATAYHRGDPHDATQASRRAYIALVREQIALKDEKEQLESRRTLRDKYARLVQRELEAGYMFRLDESLEPGRSGRT